jgi:hypothetical protein
LGARADFWNNEVLQNTNGVLEIIRDSCLSHHPLNPLPSREGIEGMVSPPEAGKGGGASELNRQGKEKLPT